MNKPSKFSAPRRATNVSLPSDMVDEAKRLGINVSQACEGGLSETIKMAQEAKWIEENRDSLLAWNAWVEENGMPYDEYRRP